MINHKDLIAVQPASCGDIYKSDLIFKRNHKEYAVINCRIHTDIIIPDDTSNWENECPEDYWKIANYWEDPRNVARAVCEAEMSEIIRIG